MLAWVSVYCASKKSSTLMSTVVVPTVLEKSSTIPANISTSRIRAAPTMSWASRDSSDGSPFRLAVNAAMPVTWR